MNYYCIDCNKSVSKKGVSRCRSCFDKFRTLNRVDLKNY